VTEKLLNLERDQIVCQQI